MQRNAAQPLGSFATPQGRFFGGALVCLLMGALLAAADDESVTKSIEAKNVLIRLIDQVDVPARATGALSKIKVAEGSIVSEGELLAQIDDTESRLELDRAQLELAIAKELAKDDVAVRSSEKAYRFAYDEYGRLARAKKSQPGSVSDSELAQAQLNAEQAGLEIEHAKNDLNSARLRQNLAASQVALANRNVEVKRIVSPIGGIIVRVLRQRGEWIAPGDPVFRVVRTDRLRAEGYIDLDDLRPGLVGQRATLSVASSVSREKAASESEMRETFFGTVLFVSPELETNNEQVRVWAEFENVDGKLHPGLRANMTIDVR